MNPLAISSFSSPTRLVFGHDAHTNLPRIIQDWGCKRVFLMVDPALVKSEITQRITQLLEDAGIPMANFGDIEPEPSDTTVAAAYERCRAHEAEAIVAIGGGSAIDVAKAVAILMTNGGKVSDYEGIEKFSVRPLPLFAVPTTAGTGSEVSSAAVITDTQRHVKMAIRHAAWGPAQVAILDPLAVASLPAHVAAHSGIDAFVHAFESYLSKLANPFSDAVNLHAMKLIAGNIRQFVANRQNTTAAMDMLCGASMAAMSFGYTGLGNVHCMAMPIGALFPVSHGLANALCLPTVAEFNFMANPARYAQVAHILGANVAGLPELDAGRLAIDAIRTLCADLGIPTRLRDVGVTESSLDELARRSFAADYNRWNPRYTSEKEFRELFAKAF
ncbi:iron-containing alcohol dehydrogenase [Achromobacter aloeverae]|uniref:Alcohol dehydrogenase n=1 Tax=Achromobacter aloeverae TaxID=1750518 RepID=A0A4Q1HE99_9BURK|nr:iron-containing alcohol dehydrogenase [Achromobacter aloeverae]RXN84638.1 alcohol dehydrogenase [Achromobacter aloeverae]